MSYFHTYWGLVWINTPIPNNLYRRPQQLPWTYHWSHLRRRKPGLEWTWLGERGGGRGDRVFFYWIVGRVHHPLLILLQNSIITSPLCLFNLHQRAGAAIRSCTVLLPPHPLPIFVRRLACLLGTFLLFFFCLLFSFVLFSFWDNPPPPSLHAHKYSYYV